MSTEAFGCLGIHNAKMKAPWGNQKRLTQGLSRSETDIFGKGANSEHFRLCSLSDNYSALPL